MKQKDGFYQQNILENLAAFILNHHPTGQHIYNLNIPVVSKAV